ncbi:9478_t:CDS:2 [Funneliformis geosporum]|uniref:13160_t:CDS:1 n=1 Tax=Funneliformis geosporum TaxID=1117311 RepID=A0A9W4SFP5_9GLOM|nr:13160_t:CDS:2 [Funneliformis geosporum]CAI2168243.1 9478_t:CDS:2 [Funneliformis geosporum]
MALANATFAEILDDLSSRFIINVPEEELASVERICFQIEQAHWFYEDFHCPLLHQWSHEHEKAFADFMQYKIRVPVCGAIMLNETMEKCVLVKGWSSRSGWGFPKGKINKDEPDSICAAREVLEETGYDISPLIKEQDYVELTIREQRIRLYIVVGVPEETEFCPKTRKEIKWHKVADLPTWIKSRDRDTPYHCGGGCVKYGSSRFYMVVPFVSKLRNWLKTQRKNRKKNAEASNQDESIEVVIFNGHAATSDAKETSPETSVPGTESESSHHEQSPNISAQLGQFSLPSLSYNLPELGPNSVLPSEELITNHSQKIFLKNIPRSDSQTPIPNKNSSDITAPIPIHANTNVAIAALDPEQKLRRNSLLNIFSSSTSSKHSGSEASIPSMTVEYDVQRKTSLLNVLQPETLAICTIPSKNLTHDDIIQHQLQQTKVQYLPESYDIIKPSNDAIFNIFQHHINQSISQNDNHVASNLPLGIIPNSTNLRDPTYDRSMMTPKISSNIGHIGQGRPTNNIVNNNHEDSRKMSLLGLLSTVPNSGNGSMINISSVDDPVNHQSIIFSNASTNYSNSPSIIQRLGTPISSGNPPHTNHEPLLRLIKSSSLPQSKPTSPKIVVSSVNSKSSTLLQNYGRLNNFNMTSEIDEKSCNRFMDDDYTRNNYATNSTDSRVDKRVDQHVSLPSGNNNKFVEDLRVRRELLDRIQEFIPPSGTKSQENNVLSFIYDKNPMSSFKFDVEKIVAAL